ncbi:MAG: hypothetical protein GYB66_07635 [Chloroflexi bacterium]|nr:hypothetical protein [Chloroflexota bacterium]
MIPPEVNNTGYPIADVVARFQNAPHPKLVLAYIDVGQVEDYRTYWQPGWAPGNPGWIAGEDPDGWAGNYPVAFWYDDYQAIWLGPAGYLQGILDAGFDGVYLDWIEAYSDESVIRIAEQDDVDPMQEILWWVEDIANFGRAQDPEFLVIGQNAAELVEHEAYTQTVDAIAQEQVWFDGAADNDPSGDCPLPRTEDKVESDAYVTQLSAPCRELYEMFPDSILHVSSESYLYYLNIAHAQGIPVFTVDYSENIAWVYQTSRELGFIPFVSNRALDQFHPAQ